MILIVGQYRCGQAYRLDNGMYFVEEELDGGGVAVLAAEALQDAAADLLLAAGKRQAIKVFPRAGIS